MGKRSFASIGHSRHRLQATAKRTNRPFAHAAIAGAALPRGCGKLIAALQPRSPERPLKVQRSHEIQALNRFAIGRLFLALLRKARRSTLDETCHVSAPK